MNDKKLLLDTHIWLWLLLGDKKLGLNVRKKILEGLDQGLVGLSAISVWEVSMLSAKERIVLDMPCVDWIESALDQAGITLIPLSPEISIESAHLPGKFHGDPADQIIVATARIEGATLITSDSKILKYSQQHYLKALKC